MTHAYRDDLEAAREKVRVLTTELEAARAELAEARGKNDEHQEILARLRAAMGGDGAPETPRPRAKLGRGRALLVGAIALVALGGGTAFAAFRVASPKIASAPPPPLPPPPAPPAPLAPQAAPAAPARPHAAPVADDGACGGESGYIDVRRGDAVTRFATECSYRGVAYPFAEVLEKPDGTPYFIVEGCDGPDKSFEIVGPVAKLPGTMSNPRVTQRTGRSDRLSSASQVKVTRFGAVGEMVDGDVVATMRPGLNEEPQEVKAHFHVCRKKDRQSP